MVSAEEGIIEPIDPSTLDTGAKQRLEAIVEKADNPLLKAEFFLKLGDDAKAIQYSEETLRRVAGGNVQLRAYQLLDDFTRAERLGISEAGRLEVAQRIYDLANEERSYGVQLQVAGILQLPDETIASIREQKLYSTMLSYSGINYVEDVKKNTENVPEDRVNLIAESAYKHLMGMETDIAGGNYIQAGQLAKEYLGRDEVLEAGRKLVEHHSTIRYSNRLEIVEMAFSQFELPEELVHPLMLRFFEDYVHLNDGRSDRIAEKHPFTVDETNGAINRAYIRNVERGNFDFALKLMQAHPDAIQDKTPMVDLRTLVGVMNYHQE